MMFSFPATPEVDLEAVTSGRGLRGTRHADGHENAEKGSRFEADADAGAAFARLLEGAFACEDGDTEVLSRIVSSGHEAGVDPEDLGKLFQLLESFGPINADGASAGDAAEPDTDVSFPGSGGIAEDLSDIPERLGRILAGLRAGSTEAGRPGMHAFFGEPFADLSQRNKISEHPVRQGAHPASADAALARIVSAFSRNAGEGRSVKHHAAQAAASGNPMAEGRTTDETAMKMRAFGGASGRMEDVRGVSPDISGGGFRERFGGGSDKAAVSSGKESLKMRAYLDTLAEQLAGEGKKETSGRMGLKMTGFRDGAADAAQLSGEPARAQGSPGTQVHGAAASTTGSISIPGGAMGAETSAFGGDGGFQGAMAESSGGKAAPAATDAGNPGPSSAAAFDKHLQSPAQLLENRVVGQVFMRLFTGAGRGSSSMTVNIHPPELGSVRVRIVSEHGRMSVHLNAQTQQVAGILERNLPALHQSLADQGIDIDDLHVGVDSGENENAGFGEHAFMDRPSGKPLHAADEDAGQASREPAPEPGYTESRGLSLRV